MLKRISLLVLLLLAVLRAPAQTVWSTGTGTAAIVFQPTLLAAAGLSIDPATVDSNSVVRFALTDASAVKFVAPWGAPNSFLGGSLKGDRGLRVAWASHPIVIEPAELFAVKDTGVFELWDEDAEAVFSLDSFDVRFDPGMHRLSLRQGNVRLARGFAERIGQKDLAGFVVGMADFDVEVHELEARIARRTKALPSACQLPPGTNFAVVLNTVEALQFAGESNGSIRVAVALNFENTGPDAPPFATLASVPLSIRVLAIEAGGTTEVARASQAMRVDPSQACPCPDMSRWYPGFLTRWTIADALRNGVWVDLLEDTLDRGGVRLAVEAAIPGASIVAEFRPRKAGTTWLFDIL